MFDTGSFVGGMIIGGVFMTIITLALTTTYWLCNSKGTKEMDKVEKETKIKKFSRMKAYIFAINLLYELKLKLFIL